MKVIEYLGYKIIYFPDEFSLSFSKNMSDIETKVSLLMGNKEVETLTFIIPIPGSFANKLQKKEIADRAIDTVKSIINDGLENNNYREFVFDGDNFKGVVDTTK